MSKQGIVSASEVSELRPGFQDWKQQAELQKARAVKALQASLRMYELNEKIKSTLDLTTRLLDLESEAELFSEAVNILTSEEGIGMLIIEHNMDFILRRDVDRIIVMDRGRILMEGTPDEIRLNRDVVEAYLGDTE